MRCVNLQGTLTDYFPNLISQITCYLFANLEVFYEYCILIIYHHFIP